MNAMALRVPELEFVDPFGGANDLAKGVLRTPVDPRQSFDDDPLRMMRAVRFVAQLGFRIEPETAEALTDMVDRIEIVSAERVRDELVKMLLPIARAQVSKRWSIPVLPISSSRKFRHCSSKSTNIIVIRTCSSTP